MDGPPKVEDVPFIVANRRWYDEILYTPIDEAYGELERRRRDPRLEQQVREFFHGDILEPLREKPRAVIARSVMSPNYEVRHFTELVAAHANLKNLEPLYLEYRADKFTANNDSKRMLARLYFFNGKGRNGGMKIDSMNILDFASSNGASFASVKTSNGQDLIDFHHEFFDACYRPLSHTFFDTSRWLADHGKSAASYYPTFLALFIRHGVLFENVLLNKQESNFAANVFLPAFISVYRHFGMKPLVVPLTPTDTEEHRLWMCYPGDDKQFVADKVRRIA
jgi:hypothetical protein